MTQNEIMERINNASKNSAKAYKSESERQYDAMMKKAQYIRENLLNDIKEMCMLVNYAISKGYAIQTYEHFFNVSEKDAPRFQSDGCSHGLGFVGDDRVVSFGFHFNVRFDAIGCEGGGCCGDTLKITDRGIITYGGRHIEDYNPNAVYSTGYHIWSYCEHYMDKVINGFADFKKRFYDFVENIDNYKCYLH